MRVVHANLKTSEGSWVSTERTSTALGRYPATWGLDALMRSDLAGATSAQFVSRPGGDDQVERWISRWLADLPREGWEGWQRVADFAGAVHAHDHPLFIAADAEIRGVEMQLPVLAKGPRGIVLVMFPVRILSRTNSAASIIVWAPGIELLGDPRHLTSAQRSEMMSAPARVDFSVSLHVTVSAQQPSDAEEANWWYAWELARTIDKALIQASEILDDWDLDLVSAPDETDLVARLRELGSLRRSVPAMVASLGPHRDFTETTQGVDNLAPMSAADALRGLVALSRGIVTRSRQMDQRVQGSTSLLSEVAASMQLRQARLESERGRRFQLAVASLASVAVVPGAVAGWAQAADVKIAGPVLAAIMATAALLTFLLLLVLLRERSTNAP
jgi:hypothetical protein